MRFKNVFISIAQCTSALTLSACVTQQDVTNKLNALVGIEEDELVSRWGPPHQSHTNRDKKKLLQYSSSDSGSIPIYTNDSTNIYNGSTFTTVTTTNTQLIPYNRNCRITFLVSRSGKIIQARWRGSTELCHTMTETDGL